MLEKLQWNTCVCVGEDSHPPASHTPRGEKKEKKVCILPSFLLFISWNQSVCTFQTQILRCASSFVLLLTGKRLKRAAWTGLHAVALHHLHIFTEGWKWSRGCCVHHISTGTKAESDSLPRTAATRLWTLWMLLKRGGKGAVVWHGGRKRCRL